MARCLLPQLLQVVQPLVKGRSVNGGGVIAQKWLEVAFGEPEVAQSGFFLWHKVAHHVVFVWAFLVLGVAQSGFLGTPSGSARFFGKKDVSFVVGLMGATRVFVFLWS